MVLGYPNGITDVPLMAQILRVADEYDAIVSRRQYKTHIDISDTLNILVDKTKPSVNDPKAKLKDQPKLNRKAVKALLKVVKVDIEYEISCIYNYIDHLKSQVKRLENIKKWHDEMDQFESQSDKDYYLSMIKKYFEPHETLDNYQQLLEEYKNAYKIRSETIQKLYDEIHKIKKIKC